jgi:anti-anti-sigma regulatory factor
MRLEGSLTIENAEGIRRSLLAYLDGEREALVDVSGVRSIDLAGMQVLMALEKECRERSIPLRLGGNPSPETRARLEDSGFIDKSDACDGRLDLAFRR